MDGRSGALRPDPKPATNHLELRILGLQRSGNHAVIQWILEQHRGKRACFLNNVRHGNHDPYATARQSYCYGFGVGQNAIAVRSTAKHVLIYSYEDDRRQMQEGRSFLTSAYDDEFESNRESYVGSSQHRMDVVILRDPFNFFASRLKVLDSLPGIITDLAVTKNDWKMLATHVLAPDPSPAGEMLSVSYNEWFSNRRYRRELSKRLLGRFSDASLASVSGFGGGSSFDSKAYSRLTWRGILRKWKKVLDPQAYRHVKRQWSRLVAPGAQKMKVLERWKELRDDRTYQEIFADPQVSALSQRLFGDLPGTREFVRQCRQPRVGGEQRVPRGSVN